MKTSRAVIIQCRLSSTRLPSKALKKLGQKTVVECAMRSMKKVPADRYFIATDFDSYETLKPLCESNGFEIFAGDLNDVLKRFCDLIKTLDVKTIIRATADNPFLFYEAAEESCIEFEQKNKNGDACDYLTWSGLPHGSGVEIFSAESLLKAAEQTSDPYDHEHVGPALYRHTDKFNCQFIPAPKKYNFPDLRSTIDTYSDYLRALQVVQFLGQSDEPYTSVQILTALQSTQVQNPVVLVPSVKKMHGTGHLHRCLSVALSSKNFFVYIPQNKTLEETDSIIKDYISKGLSEWQIISQLPDETYKPVIVTDSFKLTKEESQQFYKSKSLIQLDEGGKFISEADYLLDIIPSLNFARKVNKTDCNFMQKPLHVKSNKPDLSKISKILVCLGGEDPAGLCVPCCNSLVKIFPDAKITAISNNKTQKIQNVDFVSPVKDLKEKLFEYDLVFTHYGLTAYEASFAGCAVILLPTTKLHLKLAQKYDFAYVSDSKISEESIKNALKSENLIKNHFDCEKQDENLCEFLKKLSRGKKLSCPVCNISRGNQKKADEIISRNENRTYRRCQNCSMVYMSWTAEDDKKYEKSYFFDDYKKQYGKTYQEDFENIKNQGFRRICEIKSILKTSDKKTLLDIGCAYGPFLSAASDSGFKAFGTDISEDAVNYVKENLKIPACCSAFPDVNFQNEFSKNQFDIVTMWYVIEHFKNLEKVLKKVSEITVKGGIFAFSTPSGQGISALSNPSHFYKISPSDHYTVWEPSKANKILKKFGFKVVKTVSTGHHPERFPEVQSQNIQKDSAEWEKIEKLSRKKNLGDTCEIYCKKIK